MTSTCLHGSTKAFSEFCYGVMVCCVLTWFLTTSTAAEEPRSPQVRDWPQKVVVTVGDIRTRIDGPKLWTLSGIDYQGKMVATEDSAYGTVLTIRGVGHLGTAHFLDVPGKPGQVEKEDVTHLKLLVDDKPVSPFTPEMNLAGSSFLMERKSKIRALDLETTVSIRDGVLIETARFHTTGPIDLRVGYPWMYAWTPQATAYVFGDEQGIQKRGQFLKSGKSTSMVVKDANWMAVFNPTTGKGSVCCYLKHPPGDAWFLLVDAPAIYRKICAYTLEDKILPKDFHGTYQSAVGFFSATEADWEERARQRASELRSSQLKQ
ncbi:MAG: hypothetical protein JWN70_1766 [Planctomycetaceae bacterium]|nr:hypothetical protein [Planctomycetaceae bacterium]